MYLSTDSLFLMGERCCGIPQHLLFWPLVWNFTWKINFYFANGSQNPRHKWTSDSCLTPLLDDPYPTLASDFGLRPPFVCERFANKRSLKPTFCHLSFLNFASLLISSLRSLIIWFLSFTRPQRLTVVWTDHPISSISLYLSFLCQSAYWPIYLSRSLDLSVFLDLLSISICLSIRLCPTLIGLPTHALSFSLLAHSTSGHGALCLDLSCLTLTFAQRVYLYRRIRSLTSPLRPSSSPGSCLSHSYSFLMFTYILCIFVFIYL